MEYIVRKDSYGKDIKMSPLALGGSSTQMMKGQYEDSFFDELLSKGINTIDLARVYGNGKCEAFFGNYLSKRNRDDFTIISKCCHPLFGIFKRVNKSAAFSDIEKSLEALKTDYVDVLLLHRDDPRVPASKIITFMNEILKKGYTRVIGVSNWSMDRIKEANDYAIQHGLVPFMYVENQFSLVERIKDAWHNGAKAFSLVDLKKIKESNMVALCYSSLADGYLSGKVSCQDSSFRSSLSSFSKTSYDFEINRQRLMRVEKMAKEKNVPVSRIALGYVLSQPCDTVGIVSMSSMRRVDENLKAVSVDITDEEYQYLNSGK